ncbi:UDP-N-acetylmuramoyl-L-alanine--D-glutamate ligase [Fusibacter ferrireducens]|uniref:UDP-N-acetylmuramoylalanine--D-glutamate ligase n=1 Tax=Fusibacter ferrireducens TaxID=2785058 RepID=A0ABR9ZMA4_9FIRM|nr:UDP-N-acetylmuramoyl-L-alanine--D-glutamate ligase [Fusibacter ferrireducens]MBF4691603.1 UDP-N-acetylmuramoyl-L-alanine--D-glutamate ligase [Fusibacter ferrireducens]
MIFKNQRVLVIGLAKSGISAIKALKEEGALVLVNDSKTATQLESLIPEIMPYVTETIFGGHPEQIQEIDLVVVSPGVPLDLPFIQKIRQKNIPIIGEIELAFQLCKGTFIGITGTNGKTTTTALTGEMFKNAGKDHFVVGNIGIPAVSRAKEATDKTVMVTELSSFQLESIIDFRAHIAAILNVTPDHLNRHKTMANYVEAKARVIENQNEADYLILNYDNEITRALGKKAKSKVIYCSQKTILDEGVYVESGYFIIRLDSKKISVCRIDEMFILGAHNVENALASIAMAYLSGIQVETIKQTLMTFKGVEHRIEYVGTINDRKFYNDSKGTNVDSTVCALKSMQTNTVLIAGGMDKGSTFEALFEAFEGKVTAMVLLGETKHLIRAEALKNQFENCVLVANMEEAVSKAYELSDKGDAILLSPACASWDMYDNFEKRGEHFKKCVHTLKD